MKKLSKHISIISILLIAITVLFVGCGSKDTAVTTAVKTTKATTKATTTETAETLPTVESLELDESLISDPEALSKGFFNILTEWGNAGCTKKIADNYFKEPGDSYIEGISKKYDTVFEGALVAKDANNKASASMQDWISIVESAHLQTLEVYCETSAPDIMPEDKEPYTSSTVFDRVVYFGKNADGSYTLKATCHCQDNADKNRGVELNGGALDTREMTPTLTFIVQNGHLKLSNIVRGEFE